MLGAIVRVSIVVVAALLILSGLWSLATSAFPVWNGVWLVGLGLAMLLLLAFERQRYRSEEADRAFEPIGPGGGEPDASLEPRFQRTDETFVDPTSGATMRVHVDHRTGERRYVAER
jgi:hypothetical protein